MSFNAKAKEKRNSSVQSIVQRQNLLNPAPTEFSQRAFSDFS